MAVETPGIVKRSLRRLLLAAGLVALVAGTTTGEASAENTLRFVTWQAEDKAFGPWWKGAIEDFEAQHPDVKIELTQVPRDSFADQMTTLFASGSPPDIVHLASFEYQAFAENGWLEDLDPYIERSGLDLEGWAGQDMCRFEGHNSCIMLLYFGYVMAYNQAMLEEAGIALPTDWEEYLAAARKLTVDKDGDGLTDQYGVGLSTAAGGGQFLTELMTYVLDAGGRFTDADGQPTFDTPAMAEALGRWKLLIEERLTPVDMPAGAVRQLLIEGKVATRVDGPWIWGLMQSAEPAIRDQLKLTAPPFHPPGGGSSNVIAMPSEADQATKDLVWEFIALVTSAPWQEKFATVAGLPSPRPGAVPADIEKTVPVFDLMIETMNEAAVAGVDRLPVGYETMFNEFAKMVTEEAQRMIVEDLDPADTAARMQERALAMK